MSTGDSPTVIHIDVEPHEVNLTLDYLLQPLMQHAANLSQPDASANMDPQLAQHVQNLSSLLTQLNDVVGHINQLDPTILAPAPPPPPAPNTLTSP
jgi:hypothetical protein